MSEELDYKPPRLTPAARDRLVKELDSLRSAREEFTQSLGFDDPIGDEADQADALERTMSRERVDQRIAEIDNLLARAEIATPAGDVVEVGTVVTVRFADGTEQALRVGDLAESDDETMVLTPNSPLGRALLGCRAGDSASYTAPGGESRVEVVSVRAE